MERGEEGGRSQGQNRAGFKGTCSHRRKTSWVPGKKRNPGLASHYKGDGMKLKEKAQGRKSHQEKKMRTSMNRAKRGKSCVGVGWGSYGKRRVILRSLWGASAQATFRGSEINIVHPAPTYYVVLTGVLPWKKVMGCTPTTTLPVKGRVGTREVCGGDGF